MMRHWRGQTGLSLVEAVVAVAILAIVLTPLFGLFTASRWATEASGTATRALTVAREQMSAALEDYDALTDGTTTGTASQFSWTREVTESWRNKRIVITVQWVERGEQRRVVLSSAISDRRGASE